MFNIKDEIWTTEEYLTEIGAKVEDITLEEYEEKYGSELWNYPISEIEHCIEEELDCVIVNFRTNDGNYEHRICELGEVENYNDYEGISSIEPYPNAKEIGEILFETENILKMMCDNAKEFDQNVYFDTGCVGGEFTVEEIEDVIKMIQYLKFARMYK